MMINASILYLNCENVIQDVKSRKMSVAPAKC